MEGIVDYKKIVEAAGGLFVGVRDNVVRFKAEPEGATLSVYTYALKSVTDVQLAMKHFRESRKLDGWDAGV
jgi:hypothetical protein